MTLSILIYDIKEQVFISEQPYKKNLSIRRNNGACPHVMEYVSVL